MDLSGWVTEMNGAHNAQWVFGPTTSRLEAGMIAIAINETE